MGEIDTEKAITTDKSTQPHIWQTFVKDIAPDIHGPESQNSILMRFCEQDWELVSVQGKYAYFKRVNPAYIAWQNKQEMLRLKRVRRR